MTTLHELLKPDLRDSDYDLDEMEVYLDDGEEEKNIFKKKKPSAKEDVLIIPGTNESIKYEDVDMYTGLQYIGKENCKNLYSTMKKIYNYFRGKSIEIDSTREKMDYTSILNIGKVELTTHIYNTNSIHEPIYSSLEIKFVLEFKLHNNGLNFSKQIKVSGSQDFGGCTPEEVKELILIIKKYC